MKMMYNKCAELKYHTHSKVFVNRELTYFSFGQKSCNLDITSEELSDIFFLRKEYLNNTNFFFFINSWFVKHEHIF